MISRRFIPECLENLEDARVCVCVLTYITKHGDLEEDH